MRMAARKEFQPDATGGECRRVRSRGWRPRGERRARIEEIMEEVVEVVGSDVEGKVEVEGVGGLGR